jgi:iron(II)-dependent oxidoreductase
MHMCWFEADAYARWAGRRLPTEAEWEKAARFDPATGRSRRFPWGDEDPSADRANLGQQYLQPAPVGSYPEGAAPSGARQLIGDVWSGRAATSALPGFARGRTASTPGLLRARVPGDARRLVRGGAGGVPGHVGNWDYPIRRQIFTASGPPGMPRP